MLEEFNDADFIPDDLFCNAIDDSSPFIILKYTFDGWICNCHFGKNETDYLELMRQTKNKFLKLVYFDCLKSTILIGEQKRILNSEGLIPIFYEVAVNIIKRRNPRYRPMWLVKEYTNRGLKSKNPEISNREIFENVGNILKMIITDQHKTHLDDIYFILKYFLGLKKKILRRETIPDNIFKAIEYWVNDVSDGNLSLYDITSPLLEKIANFYELVNIDIKANKEIVFKRYKQFYDEKVDEDILNIDNIQSIHSHKRFTKYMLDITQKYCVNEVIKDNLIDSLKKKYERLNRNIPIAMKNLPLIEGSNTISIQEIERALRPFENDTLPEFLQKIIIKDYFIPDIPAISSEVYGVTGFLPTISHDEEVTRYYDAGNPIIMRTFSYKSNLMHNLVYLNHKLKEYEKYEFLGSTYAFIHLSHMITDLSKKMFHLSLEHYGRGDYFLSIQISIFQIEHILRTLCEKKGILNLYKDEKKELSKGLEPMIRELREEKVLSEKVLFFIEWFLIGSSEIMSENIRNKIAHGISNLDQFNEIYTKHNALSIILIYLSLSKLKFTENLYQAKKNKQK